MSGKAGDILLFVSLKTYFSYVRTQDWIQAVSKIVRDARITGSPPMEVAIFPDVVSLGGVAGLFDETVIALGAQDVAPDGSGSQTGEVSARVLAEIGCKFVEIGHAERRLNFGDSDELIVRKLSNAVAHGLVPVLCVGEMAGEEGSVVDVCSAQLKSALAKLDRPTRLVIAYEPIRAIGGDESAPLDQVFEIADALRKAAQEHPFVVDAQVIYGGSAGPETVLDLRAAVDGLFLGRFVHDPDDFARVIEAYGGSTGASAVNLPDSKKP
jgi:triosephosphate isomerase